MKNTNKQEWVILTILSLMIAFQSCQRVNLSKKSDATCTACYGYILDNCPQLAKTDTIKQAYIFTMAGENLRDTLFLPSLCDSIKNGNWKDSVRTIFVQKKGNLTSKLRLHKSGRAEIECSSDTVVFKKYISVPCTCVFTDKDLANYAKSKVANFWHKFRWWIIGIAIGIITSLIIIKQIRK